MSLGSCVVALPALPMTHVLFFLFLPYSHCPLFLRVPSLCDFEPLNHHTEALHQLVQAARSVDEMSQTITDLLSELKVLNHRLLKLYLV